MISIMAQAAMDLDAAALTTDAMVATVVIVLLYFFVIRGVFLVGKYQLGILTRKFTGKKMPPGQIIARHNQIGTQAATLMPGLYYRFPLIWGWKKVAVTQIGPEQIGIVESIDGDPMPRGRLLGNEVECNHFQDGEAFLEGHGIKGPQVAILRPGNWRINTELFSVTQAAATNIPAGKLGVVTAEDGLPLSTDCMIAPKPADAEGTPANHNFFQNGQVFLDNSGYRGPQLDTLQPGRYYINPLLFIITQVDVTEIPPGFVGVVRSNVGKELLRPEATPTSEQAPNAGLDDKIHADVERVLVTDWSSRGILKDPVAPGKYNLNTLAYTLYQVPTSAIMVDWAREDRPTAPSMSRPPATPESDRSDYPYLTDSTRLGRDYFKFNQLSVTSKDGFKLGVDVRMVVRILPENASFVMARFGSVFNLIQQIVHPLIDASFRNKAGEKDALDFVKARTELQLDALKKAKEEFELYHVEAQNLLISYIDVPQELLDTQTKKQVAVQQQSQFEQEAKAQEMQIVVQEKTARAKKQPDVVNALLSVDINANNAKALVKTAEGDRDAARIRADGQAGAIRKVGEAQADAYHAQSDVIGSDRVALLNLADRLELVKPGTITPEVLLVSGKDSEGMTSTMFSAYMATLLSGRGAAPSQAYRSKKEDDYASPLVSDQPASSDQSSSMTQVQKKDSTAASDKKKG